MICQLLFPLFTPYICLLFLYVFVTFWPCCAKRGRSIEFIDTFLLISFDPFIMMMMIWFDTSLGHSVQSFLGLSQEKSLLSSLSKCTQWKFKFGIIKAKRREIVRDRGATWRSSNEEFLSFYMHNSLLKGICIDCCFLVLIYLCVHHALSCRSR